MAQLSSLERVLTILKRLNNGKTIDIKIFANEYSVSERTVRRDIELIKNTFDNFLIKDGFTYKAVDKNILNNVLTGKDLATLISVVDMFKNSGVDFKPDKELEKIFKDSKDIYKFINKPFEQLKDKSIIKNIEKAIKYKQKTIIGYNLYGKIKLMEINPYKILMLNDNFYLAGEIENEYGFALLRIGMVKTIELKKSTFRHFPRMVDFIDNIQTPFSHYTVQKNEIEVKVEVEYKISRYFKMKKYLPSQKITKENSNGSIELTFVVTDLREVTELVEKWLPNMKVISPEKLKKNLKKILLLKLKSLS